MNITWELNARASSDKFIVFVPPKSGTTSIVNWSNENGMRTGIQHELKPEYVKDDTRDMYFVWRPPYERILTGLNTGLNTLAIPLERKRPTRQGGHYLNLLEHFATHCDFDRDEVVKNHTVTLTCPQFNNNIFWVHVNQLSILSDYLNEKYDRNYTVIPALNKTEDRGPSNLYYDVPQFKNRLKDYPALSLAIARKAAQDYIPPALINLK